MAHLVHLLLIGICLQNGRALAGEPPPSTRTSSTTASTPAALNPDLVDTDNSDTLSEQREGSPPQSESDEEVVEPKNATDIPEKTNVTEETIENIVLPEKGAAEKEHSSSLAIAFLLFTLILTIFMIHAMLQIKFHYLPESR